MATPTEKQKSFIINTAVAPNANTNNTKARVKPQPPSKVATKQCKTRRDIEWHMDQRRLKQELADFGTTDENLS
jgi:hypothetical protein